MHCDDSDRVRSPSSPPFHLFLEGVIRTEWINPWPRRSPMNNEEAKIRADLDAALAAVKESNRLLMQSILTSDSRAIEKRVVKLRASRWKLAAALREFHRFADGGADGH